MVIPEPGLHPSFEGDLGALTSGGKVKAVKVGVLCDLWMLGWPTESPREPAFSKAIAILTALLWAVGLISRAFG